MAQYGTLITNIGLAQIANAQITQSKVGLEYIALGDGNGAHYVPTQNQTALVHEVWRGPIAELSIDPTNSNRIIIDAVIPVTAGGFTIREIGIFDDKNQLIAIGQYPEKYKPQLSEGVSEETVVHFVIETNNAEVVKLTIDPTVIIASRNYVDGKVAQVQAELTEHSGQSNINAHKIGNIDGLQTALDEIADSQMTVNGKTTEYNGDYNLLTKSGFYNGSVNFGASNLPPGSMSSYLVEVYAMAGYSNNYTVQIARELNNPNNSWTRLGFSNGSWNQWDRAFNSSNTNIYVDSVLGSDKPENGWSSGEKALKTLNQAIFRLSRYNLGEATIHLADGQYGFVSLSGMRGSRITIKGNGIGKTFIDLADATECDNVMFRDLTQNMGFDFRSVKSFSLQNVSKTSSTNRHGVYLLNSIGSIFNSTFSNSNAGYAGIKADNNSIVILDTVAGVGNATGIDCELSVVRRCGSTITGTTPTRATNGGQIL